MYRSDIDALEARVASLDGEVKDRTRARDQAAQMLAEARARAEMSGLAADWAAGGPTARRRRRARIAAVCTIGVMMSSALVVGLVRHYHTDDRAEVVMAKFAVLTDDLCACHDKACANQVMDSMTKWSQDMARQDPLPKMSDEDMQRATELGKRMSDCLTSAMATE